MNLADYIKPVIDMRTYVKYEDVSQAGEIRLVMGNKPNEKRGIAEKSVPLPLFNAQSRY